MARISEVSEVFVKLALEINTLLKQKESCWNAEKDGLE